MPAVKDAPLVVRLGLPVSIGLLAAAFAVGGAQIGLMAFVLLVGVAIVYAGYRSQSLPDVFEATVSLPAAAGVEATWRAIRRYPHPPTLEHLETVETTPQKRLVQRLRDPAGVYRATWTLELDSSGDRPVIRLTEHATFLNPIIKTTMGLFNVQKKPLLQYLEELNAQLQ